MIANSGRKNERGVVRGTWLWRNVRFELDEMWEEGIPGGKAGPGNGVKGMRACWAPSEIQTWSKGMDCSVHGLKRKSYPVTLQLI